MSAPWLRIALCAWLAVAGLACAPAIGDECETALNCSAQGSRLCDRTQPGGYCTIRGCERGTCPEDSICVKFRPSAERLAVTYCMAACEDNGDCRDDDGYRCTSAADFGEGGDDAVILGSSKQRFCSIAALEPDDLQSHDDAAVDAGRDDAAVDAGRDDAGRVDTDASAADASTDASEN